MSQDTKDFPCVDHSPLRSHPYLPMTEIPGVRTLVEEYIGKFHLSFSRPRSTHGLLFNVFESHGVGALKLSGNCKEKRTRRKGYSGQNQRNSKRVLVEYKDETG